MCALTVNSNKYAEHRHERERRHGHERERERERERGRGRGHGHGRGRGHEDPGNPISLPVSPPMLARTIYKTLKQWLVGKMCARTINSGRYV